MNEKYRAITANNDVEGDRWRHGEVQRWRIDHDDGGGGVSKFQQVVALNTLYLVTADLSHQPAADH